MDGPSCAEKARLSKALVEAIKTAHAAKTPEEKLYSRKAERDALHALQAHRKAHGC
jgi:hypothetical protein